MAHARHLREKARSLRVERRLTIDELAERLALSRSTIYHWVRDLPIERNSARQSAAQRKRSARNADRCRRRRQAAYDEGRAEFLELDRDGTFRDFVCMYIGEGYKRSRNTVAVSNSDPVAISLCARWIERCSRNPVAYLVQYHTDHDPERLQAFWAFRLGVSPSAIKTYRKANSGRLARRQWRCKHGVVQVRAHDTAFRARLQAWIDLVKLDWTTG